MMSDLRIPFWIATLLFATPIETMGSTTFLQSRFARYATR